MDAQIASSGSQCRLRTIECNPPKNRPKGKNTGEPQSKWQGQVLIPDQAIFQWTSEMAAFISFRNCKMAAFMYLMRNFHWTPFLEFWPTPTSAVTSFSSCGLHSVCLCIFIWCRFNGHWKKEKDGWKGRFTCQNGPRSWLLASWNLVDFSSGWWHLLFDWISY